MSLDRWIVCNMVIQSTTEIKFLFQCNYSFLVRLWQHRYDVCGMEILVSAYEIVILRSSFIRF